MWNPAVRFLLAVLVTALAAVGATLALYWIWTELLDGAQVSIHGWIALGLGLFGTGGLAWLLMSLAFRSSREGWDDRADDSLGERD